MNFSKSMKRNIKNGVKILLVVAVVIVILIPFMKGCTATNDGDSEPEKASQEVAEMSFHPIETPTVSEPSEANELTEPKLISLGEFRLTAYCGCSKCCGIYGENRPVDEYGKTIVETAGGYRAVEGVTVAADIRLLPYGTKVIIDGHEYIVQDKGGVINGNRIDIYFENHQDALNFGVQYKEVFMMEGEQND